MLCFCFVFLRLGYPMLAVSLHCPFFSLPLQYSLTFIFLDKKLFCMVFDCLPYIANIYNCTYKTQKLETEYRGNMDHLCVRFAWPTLFQHLGQSPVCLCLFILFSYFIFVYLLLCLHS